MLITLTLKAIVGLLGVLLSWLPDVTTLPNILDYDIDATLVSGMGMFNSFASAFWPVQIVFSGFLFLTIYFSIKMILKFFLGHRAPGLH